MTEVRKFNSDTNKIFIKITILCAYLFFFICDPALAEDKKQNNNNNRFLINTGSFVYIYPSGDNYTQYFDNKLLSFGVRINDSTHIIAGSSINSYNDRCFLLGVEKNWYDFNNRLSFEGLYGYMGEFFFDEFKNCGTGRGVYSKFRSSTGVGFSLYIYSGLEYDINSFLSLEAGFILPAIFVTSIQWKF